MIFSWEDFLTGHSPKEHELDGSDYFMLFPMPWCFGWASEAAAHSMGSAVMVQSRAGLLGSWAEPGGKWQKGHSLCLFAKKSHTT